MTRDSDINLGLRERAGKAKRIAADAFVSIHFNGFYKNSVRGSETWYPGEPQQFKNKSIPLARSIQDALIRVTGTQHSRGIKNDRRDLSHPLGILKYSSHSSNTAAVLVEIDFLTNFEVEQKLKTSSYRQSVAVALANGMDDYVEAKKCSQNDDGKRPPTPPEKPEDLIPEGTYPPPPPEKPSDLVSEEPDRAVLPEKPGDLASEELNPPVPPEKPGDLASEKPYPPVPPEKPDDLASEETYPPVPPEKPGDLASEKPYPPVPPEKPERIVKQVREGKQRRGRNFGDPHLFTFDGHRYSFQDVGEFVLAKSDDNFFEVQVRQSPMGASLAVDSAVAMAVGDTRVALYSEHKDLPDNDSSTPLRIDGKPVNLRKELKLSNGGKVYRKGSDYVIEWPTKEKIVAQVNSSSETPFINISAFVFESQADHISGLLGNDNGKKDDDLRFRDGRILPSRSTYGDMKNILNRVVKVRLPIDPALNAYLKKLTKEYGNSWRISQEESLFDYAPGMNTASFTLKGFPSEYLTLSQLPTNLVRDAQKTCISSGVEPEMMEGCVFDVAYSGYGGFARAAAQASQVMDILEDAGIRVPRPRLPGGIKLPGRIRLPW